MPIQVTNIPSVRTAGDAGKVSGSAMAAVKKAVPHAATTEDRLASASPAGRQLGNIHLDAVAV